MPEPEPCPRCASLAAALRTLRETLVIWRVTAHALPDEPEYYIAQQMLTRCADELEAALPPEAPKP